MKRAKIECCDPPCRLMKLQEMTRDQLLDAVLDAETEAEMATAEVKRLQKELDWALANLPTVESE